MITIKIQCQCGTKFAFDVEPAAGEMPHAVACPNCNTDATEQANAIIASSQGPAGEPAQEPAAASGTALRINREPEPEPAPSPESLEEALPRRVIRPGVSSERMERERIAAQERKAMFLIKIGGAIAAVLMVGWIWYAFVGSKPSVTFSAATVMGEDESPVSKMISRDEAVVITGDKVELYDLTAQGVRWTHQLEKPESGGGFFDFLNYPIGIPTTDNSVWIVDHKRAIQLDRTNGSVLKQHEFAPSAGNLIATDRAIFSIVEPTSFNRSLTRIDLVSGESETMIWQDALAHMNAATAHAVGRPGTAVPTAMTAAYGSLDAQRYATTANGIYYAGDDHRMLLMNVKLVNRDFIPYKTAKGFDETWVVDSKGVSAADGAKAAEQFLKGAAIESAGGRGVGDIEYEDNSKYRVEITGFFDGASVGWSGEVLGPPKLFALRDSNVLFAGRSVHVFDKQFNKRWESKLGYPIAEYGWFGQTDIVPCLESGNTLFCFDQGVLYAFDLQTGNARWRLPSVGIASVTPDGKGNLYVCSTTAAQERIQYTMEVSLTDKDQPALLKVEAATGKLLWQSEKMGESCVVTDGFVYATRSVISSLDQFQAAVNKTDVPVHYFVFRVDPGSGEKEWELYRNRPPQVFNASGNRLMLQFTDKMEVAEFFSL